MKRFASIDYLRGLAILLMIILHLIDHTLDMGGLLDVINEIPLMNLVALLVLPFFGGLAGFFLLVSSIGNMISMQKYLEAGNSATSLLARQLITGIILLFFAGLVEGAIGWLGALGQFLKNVFNPEPEVWKYVLWRWNFFETIHTIAWCIIVNGIVQAILSAKGKWKNTRRIIISYIVLSIIVLASTTFVWMGVQLIGPGYPYIDNPYTIGTTPFLNIIEAIFLNVLAGRHEPLFPYLVTSFVGSIIGIVISQPREKIPKHFVKRTMLIALICFIIGMIGVIFIIIQIMDAKGFNAAVELYKFISHHRDWFPDHPTHPAPYYGWFFQFLFLNGFSVMGTMLLIYLVEFRGKGAKWANETKFVRRFGFTAFTNYSQQYIIFIVFLFTSALFTTSNYNQVYGEDTTVVLYKLVGWDGMFVTLILTLFVYHILMLAWESIGYIGSLEWAMGTIASFILPSKKKSNVRWWERGKLQVNEGFYNAEWLTTLASPEKESVLERDSRLYAKLGSISLFSIFFMPFGIAILIMSLHLRKEHGMNKYLKRALVYSIIATIIVVTFVVFCLIATPNMLGFSL